MKTVKLIIEDKEIEVQISDDQVAELTKPKKVTGFERAKHNENLYYYTVNSNGKVGNTLDITISDEKRYEIANYYTSKELAEWCCRSDNLKHKMRRWAAEHNEEPMEWTDDNSKFSLFYDYCVKEVTVSFFHDHGNSGLVYFNTEELAEQAIKEFGDEMKWLAENRPKWF